MLQDPSRARFHTTRWSLVLAAGDRSRPALEELSAAYWPPVYAFLRRRGHDPAAAEEHCQAFFVELLRGDLLGKADAARGRFRSYLLGCLRHFVADANRREARGGRVPFDPADLEASLAATPDDSPEAAFERAWGILVLERAFGRVRDHYVARGEEVLFDGLRASLGEARRAGYGDLARELGRSENALRVAAHRLRRRLREELEREVRDTVGADADVHAELAGLARALAGGAEFFEAGR